MDISQLREPFVATDVEWRIQQSGKGKSGLWARVIPYIKNRAVMERLDNVVGAENWRNEYAPAPNGGIMCGLSIKIDGEWVTKWDGAANTEVKEGGKLDEDTNIKGGFSASMKRSAVLWGIGRYLYYLEAGYADIVKDDGRYFARIKYKENGKDEEQQVYWNPPQLPAWALPKKKDAAHEGKGVSGKQADAKPATSNAPKAEQPKTAAPATTPASPDKAESPKEPPAPPPQNKPNAAEEIASIMSSVYDGTTTPIFDEAYKATIRSEINAASQQYGKKVAYETALEKVKTELTARLTQYVLVQQPAKPDPQMDIF